MNERQEHAEEVWAAVVGFSVRWLIPCVICWHFVAAISDDLINIRRKRLQEKIVTYVTSVGLSSCA